MSLTSQLLSGVTESAVSLAGYDYSGKCKNETIWLDAACEALMTDIYNVDKSYMIADVIGECKVITEGADPAILLEGLIKSAVDKVIEAFKKFWAKIKEFFAAVKEWFKKMTLHGKEFAKYFKDKLTKIKVKGFSYTGYTYDFAAGDKMKDDIFSKVEARINNILSVVHKLNKDYVGQDPSMLPYDARRGVTTYKNDGWDDVKIDQDNDSPIKTDDGQYKLTVSGHKLDKGDYKNTDLERVKTVALGISAEDTSISSSEYQDKFIKTLQLGASDLSELQEKLEDKYHKNSESSDIHDDFEHESVSDMISFLTTFDKVVSETDKEARQFDKVMSNIIKQFDNLKKDEVKGGDTKIATTYSSYLTSLLTVGKMPFNVKSAMYKEAAGVYEKALKSLLSYKPAKEGYDYYGQSDTDSVSLFESAMMML